MATRSGSDSNVDASMLLIAPWVQAPAAGLRGRSQLGGASRRRSRLDSRLTGWLRNDKQSMLRNLVESGRQHPQMCGPPAHRKNHTEVKHESRNMYGKDEAAEDSGSENEGTSGWIEAVRRRQDCPPGSQPIRTLAATSVLIGIPVGTVWMPAGPCITLRHSALPADVRATTANGGLNVRLGCLLVVSLSLRIPSLNSP